VRASARATPHVTSTAAAVAAVDWRGARQEFPRMSELVRGVHLGLADAPVHTSRTAQSFIRAVIPHPFTLL
jgi:hypothetical protein